MKRIPRPVVALALGLLLSAGPARADEEADVRAAFKALQAALKAADGEKVHALLDRDSQLAAGRAARSWKERYASAGAKNKARLEKMFGLKGAEMSGLTAALYLRSKRFLGKYDEVPGSKVDRVSVAGAKATVYYTEPDGDKEDLAFVRQGGKWKVSLRIE